MQSDRPVALAENMRCDARADAARTAKDENTCHGLMVRAARTMIKMLVPHAPMRRASSVLSFTHIRVPVMPLLSLLVSVFIGFLVVGIALPVLPLHVHDGLGQGTFMVGLVTGSQFAAALATRMWAGNHADTKGAKRAVVVGLLAASAGGWLYLLSLQFVHAPKLSSAILLVGRTVLGGGESFIITGALGWGVALAGAEGTGKVMSWMGTAMYAAFAAGAPIGTALYGGQGFTAVAGATAVVPLMTLLLVARLSPVAPRGECDRPF
jgi:MFS family permease